MKKILDDHGIVPDPERRTRGDWMQFIMTQKDVAASMDFMTVELLTPFCLERRHVLFFMDIGTRKVVCGGISHDPDGNWTTQIAWNQSEMFDGFLLDKKYLIHDRDSLFGKRFDAVFESIGITVKRTLPFHPDMNAFMEAFIKSARTECFDRIIFTSEAQLRMRSRAGWTITTITAATGHWMAASLIHFRKTTMEKLLKSRSLADCLTVTGERKGRHRN